MKRIFDEFIKGGNVDLYNKFVEKWWFILILIGVIALIVVGTVLISKKLSKNKTEDIETARPAKKSKFSPRMLVTGAMCIGLAFILSYIKIWDMPLGGAITPASGLPIILFAYIYGSLSASKPVLYQKERQNTISDFKNSAQSRAVVMQLDQSLIDPVELPLHLLHKIPELVVYDPVIHLRITVVDQIRVARRSNAVHPLDLIDTDRLESAVSESYFKFSRLRRFANVGHAQHVHSLLQHSHLSSLFPLTQSPKEHLFDISIISSKRSSVNY